MNRLVSDDARPLAVDPVVDAVLAVKHAQKVTQSHLDALQALDQVDVSLVVTNVDWSGEYPVLTYAVEHYEFLENHLIPTHLYRYADDDAGVWFAGHRLHARLHGRGFHENPQMWTIPSSERNVLVRMRTRFGKTLSPAEFIAV
jgi:hypothetical protein